MRIVVQRVKSASLSVEGKIVSEIKTGLLVFAGVCIGDTQQQVVKSAKKISTLRIFEENGKMNKSVIDIDGEVLLVSNFTLCTKDVSGARPDFGLSASRDEAKYLYLALADELDTLGVKVKLGVFGADMQISAHLDGPTTIYKEIQ